MCLYFIGIFVRWRHRHGRTNGRIKPDWLVAFSEREVRHTARPTGIVETIPWKKRRREIKRDRVYSPLESACSTVHGSRGPEAFPLSAAHPRETMHAGIMVLSVALCQANYALSVRRRSLLLETKTLTRKGENFRLTFLRYRFIFFKYNLMDNKWRMRYNIHLCICIYVYIIRWWLREHNTRAFFEITINGRGDVNDFVRGSYSVGLNCYSRQDSITIGLFQWHFSR